MLIGILQEYGAVPRYVGLDVHEPSLHWLHSTIRPIASWSEFYRVDYVNERYNPKGDRAMNAQISGTFDRIVLYSVFSHMWLRDIEVYLGFIRDRLTQDGRVLCTLFVEQDVPDEQENPSGYLFAWKGPMHCVRLNRGRFEQLVRDAGLAIEDFGYRKAGSLSIYTLRRAD